MADPALQAAENRPLVTELSRESAITLARFWYQNLGPFRGAYEMQPRSAHRNDDTHWSVRFKVEPDTGTLYLRK
jgi:hypothetical protein